MSPYRFRAVTEADLPLLGRWRAAPHVAAWWGPPEVEDAAVSLADPRIAMWIVAHSGQPFAYAQDYRPRDWESHPFAHLPEAARGIDHYIGEPDMIGRGHGGAFIRLHCERLFAAGAPAIGTDPNPDNGRAIRAYQKAGFERASGPVDTRWGRAVLMERWRDEPQARLHRIGGDSARQDSAAVPMMLTPNRRKTWPKQHGARSRLMASRSPTPSPIPRRASTS